VSFLSWAWLGLEFDGNWNNYYHISLIELSIA